MTRSTFNIIKNTFVTRKKTSTLVPHQSYSTKRAYDFITTDAKQYATDGTGIHTSQQSIICDKSDCEKKDCLTPCGELQYSQVDGHYTHKPPEGTQSVHLDSKDFSGKTTKKGQHFVKPSQKPKIPADELKNLTEDDMKKNMKATDYVNDSQDIYDKIYK